jgi:hypothetical protein
MSLLRSFSYFPSPAAIKMPLLRSLKRPPETQSKTERSQSKNKNGERDAVDAEEPPPSGLKPA